MHLHRFSVMVITSCRVVWHLRWQPFLHTGRRWELRLICWEAKGVSEKLDDSGLSDLYVKSFLVDPKARGPGATSLYSQPTTYSPTQKVFVLFHTLVL